jgi:hypothetical protein
MKAKRQLTFCEIGYPTYTPKPKYATADLKSPHSSTGMLLLNSINPFPFRSSRRMAAKSVSRAGRGKVSFVMPVMGRPDAMKLSAARDICSISRAEN